MKKIIDYWLDKFPQMTKEDADYIESVVKWTDEQRAGFMFAKRIFEEKDEIEEILHERKRKNMDRKHLSKARKASKQV